MITINNILDALNCPRTYYLSIHRKDLIPKKTSSFGKYFVSQAKLAFSKDMIEVSYSSPEDMVEDTAREIKNHKRVSNATFIYGDMCITCDIFELQNRRKKKVNLYGISSSTSFEARDIDALAIQGWVLEKMGYTINNVSIITVDSNYVNTGDYEAIKAFKTVDVASTTKGRMLKVPSMITQARDNIAKAEKEPEIKISCNCKDCVYRNDCTEKTGADIFKMTTMTIGTKIKLYNNGIESYQQILDIDPEEFKVSESSLTLASYNLAKKPIIDVKKIKEFLSEFQYPLYFLDFESYQMGMPEWDNTSAYMQIPFQYSLHKMRETDTEDKVKHMEFLGESGKDPRRSLALSLIRDVKKRGSIVAYNATFERTIIRRLAETFPDLADALKKIEDRIVDLMIPFSKRWYYDQAFEGKYSIKVVLPVLFPSDPSLNYKNLDNVHNGTEAMTTFADMQYMIPEDVEIMRNSLLEYCCLDTWAMVKIYNFLINL